jgi:hypothetical protein
MRLRTTAGAHAGEIRDYTFSAAQAALRVGSAEIVADESIPSAANSATTAPTERQKKHAWRPIKRK